MRPLFAVLINIILIGGLFLYTGFRDTEENIHHGIEPEESEGIFSLEIATTFKIGVEESFSLSANPNEDIIISINGIPVRGELKKSPFSSSFRVDNLPGIIEGKNEIFLELSRLPGDAARSAAVNLEIRKDGVRYFSDVYWFEPEEPVVITCVFDEDREKGK